MEIEGEEEKKQRKPKKKSKKPKSSKKKPTSSPEKGAEETLLSSIIITEENIKSVYSAMSKVLKGKERVTRAEILSFLLKLPISQRSAGYVSDDNTLRKALLELEKQGKVFRYNQGKPDEAWGL